MHGLRYACMYSMENEQLILANSTMICRSDYCHTSDGNFMTSHYM